jgi:hypothetical protein
LLVPIIAPTGFNCHSLPTCPLPAGTCERSQSFLRRLEASEAEKVDLASPKAALTCLVMRL